MPIYSRANAFCFAIKHGSTDDFEFSFEIFIKTQDSNLKAQLLNALSCTKDLGFLNKYLENFSRNSSFVSALRNVAVKSNGNYLAWNLIRNNWSELNAR